MKILYEIAQAIGTKVESYRTTRNGYAMWAIISGSKGCYNSFSDTIVLNDDFQIPLTLAHELIHASGTGNRIARIGIIDFENRQHINDEEIIAEYGALILVRGLGLETPDDPAIVERYLKSWGRLDGKPTLEQHLDAVRAVNYLLEALESSKKQVA